MNYLIAHLIGDYLAQNDWMAQNKKSRSWPCLVHVVIYAAVMWLFTRWAWQAIAVVFVTHFIQDRTAIVRFYMVGIGQTKFLEPPLFPWSIIVVDNVMHLVVLFFLDQLHW